jgi:hypothetical protein
LIYRNFLYCNIAQKKNLAKPIAKIYSQGFYRNLFHIFPSVISFSTNLRILSKFLEIQAGKSIKKSVAQLWLTPAQGNSSWPRRPATRGQPKRPTGLILAGMVWCQATWPARPHSAARARMERVRQRNGRRQERGSGVVSSAD